jgi:methionyl-tRNA formyltransferase
MKVLLIINKKKLYSNKVISFSKKKFRSLKIIDHAEFNKIKLNNFDYVLSYLSKVILRKNFLNKTKKLNINFHPGPPKYPGSGCYNLALLKNDNKYGVSSHLMNEKIDNGKIIKTIYFKIDNSFDVEKILQLSYQKMFTLFKQTVNMIVNNKIHYSKEKWSTNAYKIKKLDKKLEIKLHYSKDKIKNIIRCCAYGEFAPYIIFKGYRFQLGK